MERHPGILWRGYHMKTALQKFGKFLSAMVMPNIGAFIAWGFITALFIADGWLPNEQLASIQPYMLTYLLPILIAATGGKMIDVQLPLNFYDTKAKPSGLYQIVISCSTSAYGDFMAGCKSNILYVDNFEWVY